MLADIALHELAVCDHLQAVGPYLVEGALDQFRADALAAQFRRHLGMIESNDTVGDFVISRGDVAVGRKFEPVFGFVIDDFAHLIPPVEFIPQSKLREQQSSTRSRVITRNAACGSCWNIESVSPFRALVDLKCSRILPDYVALHRSGCNGGALAERPRLTINHICWIFIRRCRTSEPFTRIDMNFIATPMRSP